MKKPRINYDNTSSWLMIFWFHNNKVTFWERFFAKYIDSRLMNGKLLSANDYESKRPHDTVKVKFRFAKRWLIKFRYNKYY